MRFPRCNQIPLHSAVALKLLLGLSRRSVCNPYTLTPRIPLYTVKREGESGNIKWEWGSYFPLQDYDNGSKCPSR